MKDDPENDIGRYAGWGSGEDANPPPTSSPPERRELLYWLRYRENNVWRDRLVWLWFPSMIVLITIEDWLHVPQLAGWLSLGGLFLVFLLAAWWTDRINRT